MIHDGRARQVAASQAAIDYATDELENSLADARAELAVERERLFGQKIRAARAELDAGRRQQSRLTHELSVFQTDYPAKNQSETSDPESRETRTLTRCGSHRTGPRGRRRGEA